MSINETRRSNQGTPRIQFMTPTFTPMLFRSGNKRPEDMTDEDKLTGWQAIVNIFNTCVGVGILAKPYAFAVGGWWSVVTLVIAGLLCIYTATLIGAVTESYNESRKTKLKGTNYRTMPLHMEEKDAMYPAIARHSFGKYGTWGKRAAITAVLSMLTPFFLIAIITIWTLVAELIKDFVTINESLLFLIVVVASIPPCLALSWKELTWLGYLGILAVISITGCVFGLSIYSEVAYGGPIHGAIDLEELMSDDKSALQNSASVLAGSSIGLFVSFAIFVMGIAGHVALPKIHANLKHTSNWKTLVFVGFGSVMSFYMIIGIVGYWLFGDDTEIIILTNFLYWPGGIIPSIVSVLVILNIWASFGIVSSLIAENFEKTFNINANSSLKRRVLRVTIFLVLAVLSYLFRYLLPFVETVQGVVSVLFSTVLTLPITMYLCCFWKTASVLSKMFHILLLIACTILGIFIFYVDVIYLS